MYNSLEIKYNKLLIKWNEKINLVSRKKENIFDLIDDSRLFLKYLPENKSSLVLDLGTGGGIPGVVLAIYRPKISFVLVDSIKKKILALQDIVNELNLKNVKVICSRAEELYKDNLYRGKVDCVVARSVAEIKMLVKWSKKLMKPGGKLITIKGKDDENFKDIKTLKFIKDILIDSLGEKQAIILEFN